MNRGQLQHMILEVGRRFDLEAFYIVGSAAILAAAPESPPGALTATRDVDVMPPDDDPVLIDRIDYVLGEASEFDDEYGYYAQGVDSKTPAYAPGNWKDRTIPLTVEETYTGRCMEPHDLVLSKLGAGREKDMEFARSAARLGLVEKETLLSRLSEEVDCADEIRQLIGSRVQALFEPDDR